MGRLVRAAALFLLTAASLIAALLSAAAPSTAAEQDVPDSSDPYGVERYPGSWIVDYQRDDAVRPRELIMSRVDRIRREIRVDEQLEVDGTLESVTYRTPDGASVEDVVTHYREELAGNALFRCAGRGCGRSADWAHQIFQQAVLYGPDRNQRYAVFEWREGLVTLYVIERGNRRIYAHLRFLEPEGPVAIEPNALLARRLEERGWSPIEGVRPAGDGTFSDEGRRVLLSLGERLNDFDGRRLYLVCHLYGADSQALMAASGRCAENAATLIGSGGGEEGGEGPALEPFAAGPLLPRSVPPRPRLELVSPEALPASSR